MSTRGDHLVRADRRFSTGGLALLKPLAPAFRILLDKIDAGLLAGGIEATLPDGSHRRLGFRTDGPVAVVRLKSWRSMLRAIVSLGRSRQISGQDRSSLKHRRYLIS